jgi:hypothetical protein
VFECLYSRMSTYSFGKQRSGSRFNLVEFTRLMDMPSIIWFMLSSVTLFLRDRSIFSG